jgi:ribosomal protein S21
MTVKAIYIPRFGEDIDSTLRHFKRAVDKQGTLRELKRRAYFTPKSQARRNKSDAARRAMAMQK